MLASGTAGPPSRRLAVAALGATFLLVPVSGLVVQRRLVGDTAYFLDRSEAVVAEADADFVVFADPSFGRFAYTGALEGRVAPVTAADAATAPGLDGSETGADTRAAGVAGRRAARPPLGPYRRTGETFYIASDYRAETLSRR